MAMKRQDEYRQAMIDFEQNAATIECIKNMAGTHCNDANGPATDKTFYNILYPYIEAKIDAHFLLKEIEEDELKERTEELRGMFRQAGQAGADLYPAAAGSGNKKSS